MAGRQNERGTDGSHSQILRVSRVAEPAVEAAIAALALSPGSSGLDAGCGIGLNAIRLARAVGAGGRVMGVDVSEDLLGHARRLAAESGAQKSLEFQSGDLLRLPFDDRCFDWAWCKDVLWGYLLDPFAGVRELARVVRPGGTVALAFWSSQVLLSGHPELEARLAEAFVRTTPYTAGIDPQRHFMAALGWMRAARLRDLEVRSFSTAAHAPLDEEMQEAVRYTIEMFFGGLAGVVSMKDWDQYRRLVDPDADSFLPRRPDYCCTVTYTVFRGARPAAGS